MTSPLKTPSNHPSADLPVDQSPALVALSACVWIGKQIVATDDIDGYGHVNNIEYYRYAQTARIGYFEQLALADDSFTIVAANSCRYLRQVYYPDTLMVGVAIKHIGTTSLTHQYLFFSEHQEKIVAIGEAVIVVMDKASGHKRPISDGERKRMITLAD